MKHHPHPELTLFTLATFLAGIILLYAYAGMTEWHCERIGGYSKETQQAMRLSPSICENPWWERL